MELICNLSDIGAVLRARREAQGKSIRTIASAIGVPFTTIQRIEKGRTSPTWGIVLAFAQALDLEPTLVPRERLRAVEAVTRMTETVDAPPLTGERW